jgi:2-polyprenyl-3-methyl-5-hydroxy-6-metoxy-1,4-benzoquinol methylase
VLPDQSVTDRLEARILAAMAGGFELGILYLGYRLGYFRGLRELGHANAGELAAQVEANSRYTREWLEAAAASALIDVWEQSASGDSRRYALTPGTEDPLTDDSGVWTMLHDVRCTVTSLARAPELVEHYRNGTGLLFSAYGEDMRGGQELTHKLALVRDLPTRWMPALGDLHQHLLTTPGARIADIGFGAGWSTIALARCYPNATVDGLDLDPESVALARENARAQGLTSEISFQVQDAADLSLSGRYDLACAFECIHDMPQPVTVLRAMRNLVGAGGTVLIGDVAVGESYTAPAELDERLDYGYSLFHCLPVGMYGPNAVGTGTLMRPATLWSYAQTAGFANMSVLPIEHPSWRFYRLTG